MIAAKFQLFPSWQFHGNIILHRPLRYWKHWSFMILADWFSLILIA